MVLLCPPACPPAAGQPLPPNFQFQLLRGSQRVFDCPQTLALQHNPINSLSEKNPPQIVIRVHSVSPHLALVPRNQEGSFASLSWQLLSLCSHPGSQQPGIWLAPHSLRYTWQVRFSLWTPLPISRCGFLSPNIDITERIRWESMLEKYLVNEKNCCRHTRNIIFAYTLAVASSVRNANGAEWFLPWRNGIIHLCKDFWTSHSFVHATDTEFADHSFCVRDCPRPWRKKK